MAIQKVQLISTQPHVNIPSVQVYGTTQDTILFQASLGNYSYLVHIPNAHNYFNGITNDLIYWLNSGELKETPIVKAGLNITIDYYVYRVDSLSNAVPPPQPPTAPPKIIIHP